MPFKAVFLFFWGGGEGGKQLTPAPRYVLCQSSANERPQCYAKISNLGRRQGFSSRG